MALRYSTMIKTWQSIKEMLETISVWINMCGAYLYKITMINTQQGYQW